MKIVEKCMKLTHFLKDSLKPIEGIQVINDPPQMNVLGFTSEYHLRAIEKRLRKRGWALGAFPDLLRVVVMPHIKEDHIKSFANDLDEIMLELRTSRKKRKIKSARMPF